jgi:hypothetical protein
MEHEPNDIQGVYSVDDSGMVHTASNGDSDERNSTRPVLYKGTTNDLFKLIAEPLAKDNGFRVLWLGDSGMGKSYANNLFVAWLLKSKLVDLILTLDTKDPHNSQYPGGTERVNPADLRQHPPLPNESRTHITFRGVAKTRKLSEDCDPDDVARLGWELVTQRKTKVLLNIDELADCTQGGQGWTAKTVAATYRKGRGVSLSLSATTQLPQILPREAFALSEVVVLFRMSGREASYLLDKRAITPESAEIVPNLTVGQCVIYDKGRGSLDGKVVFIGS